MITCKRPTTLEKKTNKLQVPCFMQDKKSKTKICQWLAGTVNFVVAMENTKNPWSCVFHI